MGGKWNQCGSCSQEKFTVQLATIYFFHFIRIYIAGI